MAKSQEKVRPKAPKFPVLYPVVLLYLSHSWNSYLVLYVKMPLYENTIPLCFSGIHAHSCFAFKCVYYLGFFITPNFLVSYSIRLLISLFCIRSWGSHAFFWIQFQMHGLLFQLVYWVVSRVQCPILGLPYLSWRLYMVQTYKSDWKTCNFSSLTYSSSTLGYSYQDKQVNLMR